MPRRRRKVDPREDARPHAWESRLRNAGLVLRCQGCGKPCEGVLCRSCREDAVSAVPRPDRARNGRDVRDDVYSRADDLDPMEE